MPKIVRRSPRRQLAIVLGMLLFFGAIETVGPAFLHSGEDRASARFQVLREFGKEAILDRHTELIWERNPSADGLSWSSASIHCRLRAIGDLNGWRLPSFLELMTLVQPSLQPHSTSAALPAGHPFRGIQVGAYWTSTVAADGGQAYSVDFRVGDISARSKSEIHPTWCVRGGLITSPDQSRSAMESTSLL